MNRWETTSERDADKVTTFEAMVDPFPVVGVHPALCTGRTGLVSTSIVTVLVHQQTLHLWNRKRASQSLATPHNVDGAPTSSTGTETVPRPQARSVFLDSARPSRTQHATVVGKARQMDDETVLSCLADSMGEDHCRKSRRDKSPLGERQKRSGTTKRRRRRTERTIIIFCPGPLRDTLRNIVLCSHEQVPNRHAA
jgi:hypothetical protein